MKHRNADTQVTIYYIDIQHFDKTFTLFRKAVEESGVRFVRGIPFSVEQSRNGKLKLHIENMDGEESIVEHDMVVLSVGMGPALASEKLAAQFDLQRDEFGFLASSSLPNVFVTGTCQEPLSIPDSMAAARAIALEMGKI
jgi:heterodisulfide reductase subunit A-like polyferredoxin